MLKNDELVCFGLQIHVFGGRKQLKPEDLLNVDASQIPPEKLASLGSKKICDPKYISKLESFRGRAENVLKKAGFRFVAGHGIPASRAQEIRNSLDELQTEFNQIRSEFLASYDSIVDQWVRDNRDWASIIRKAVVPRDVVAGRISFDYQVFRIAKPADSDEDDIIEDGAYGAILRDVEKRAGEYWSQSLKGKASVTQRAKFPFREIRDKIQGLSFIDTRIDPLVNLIDETLDSLPKTGDIEDGPLRELSNMALILSDADQAVSYGEEALKADADNSDEEATEVDSESDDPASVPDSDSVETESNADEALVSVSETDDEPVAPASSPTGLFFG